MIKKMFKEIVTYVNQHCPNHSHLADLVIEPSLFKSALVYQYLYKKIFFRKYIYSREYSLSR